MPRLSVFCLVASRLLVAQAAAAQATDAPAPASVEPAAATKARALFAEGVAFSEQGAWAKAEAAFAESASLVPAPKCLLNLAVARFELKKPLSGLEAVDRFDALSSSLASEQRERASAIRAQLQALLATRRVTLKPATAELLVEGVRISGTGAARMLRLDPGVHKLVARAPGYVDLEQELDVGAGTQGEVTLVLAPSAASGAPASMAPKPTPPAPRYLPLEPDLRARRAADGDARHTAIWRSPWLWLGVGLVAVGAGVAVYAATRPEPRPVSGSEGITINLD